MNEINLKNLKLKTFTEQDALDYCQINNINIEDITVINLDNNELTDISGIRLFKNLEVLWLGVNKLTDIKIIKKLKNLEVLHLNKNNELKDISVLKDLINIKKLNIFYTAVKNISFIQYLKDLKLLNIIGLELESNQIQYIKSLNNLEILYCKNGFKDMSVTDQLNKNIINIVK